MNIDNFHEKLINLQAHYQSKLQNLVDMGGENIVILDQQSVGRLSRIDAIQSQEMAFEQKRRIEITLQAIKSALLRIQSNEYGDCIQCGEQIDFRRLEMTPYVTHCISCAK